MFMLAAGYASGTPMTFNDSVALAAAAASSPRAFDDTNAATLAAELRTILPDDKVQSACSRERPVVIDVGGGMGLSSVVAGE